MYWSLSPKKSYPNRITWSVWKIIGKVPFVGLIFVWPDTILWGKFSPPGIVENKQWQLFPITAIWGSSKSWVRQEAVKKKNKKLQRSIWKMRCSSFEKFQHFCANIEDHVYVQGRADAWERLEKAVIPDHWLTVRLFANKLWKLRQSWPVYLVSEFPDFIDLMTVPAHTLACSFEPAFFWLQQKIQVGISYQPSTQVPTAVVEPDYTILTNHTTLEQLTVYSW